MKIEYFKEFSRELNRAMEYKVYGEEGINLICFPTRGGRFYDFENFGLIDSVKEVIDNWDIKVYTLDSIDHETFLGKNEDHERISLHEKYYNYVVNEFIPMIRKNSDKKIYLVGIDVGASHALNFFLRRPDLVDGVIAMSGIYDLNYFFNNYNDSLIYLNSPLAYLYNLDKDHPYIKLYNEKTIICSTGQGANEDPCVYDTHALKQELLRLGVRNANFDFWGSDVDHDWYWWKKQLAYFVSQII